MTSWGSGATLSRTNGHREQEWPQRAAALLAVGGEINDVAAAVGFSLSCRLLVHVDLVAIEIVEGHSGPVRLDGRLSVEAHA
jgi:hypothetical protein